MRVGLIVASVIVLLIGVVKTATMTSASPVGREAVANAFARVGEPLTVRLDMAKADPGSPVDVIYVPANQDVANAPFELDLFDEVESAAREEQLLQSFGGSKPLVARARNALLITSRTMPAARRAGLMSALETLQ